MNKAELIEALSGRLGDRKSATAALDAVLAEIQNAVTAHVFEPRPGVRVPLSISAGPARFPADGRSFEELLASADERMYRDKAGRRSRNSVRHSKAQLESA